MPVRNFPDILSEAKKRGGRPKLGVYLSLWLPPIAWMGLIFLLSSLPVKAIPEAPPWSYVLAHFTEFFVLAALMLRAINGGLGQRAGLLTVAVAFALTIAYGMLDELHQAFVPGRVPDFFDICVDATGAAAACLLLAAVLLVVHGRGRRS